MMATIRTCLLASVVLGCSLMLCGAAEPTDRDMVLWYRQPAGQWLQAMPLGNGMIGAMVFGGVPQERIALNESSFWSGRPHNYDDQSRCSNGRQAKTTSTR